VGEERKREQHLQDPEQDGHDVTFVLYQHVEREPLVSTSDHKNEGAAVKSGDPLATSSAEMRMQRRRLTGWRERRRSAALLEASPLPRPPLRLASRTGSAEYRHARQLHARS
jgi:hypothetical protein